MPLDHDHADDDPGGLRNHHGHAHHAAADSSAFTELLDLDAEVLADYWTAALDIVKAAAPEHATTTVLDLGAGSGSGALGLAPRFLAAEILALDISAESLRRLDEKAAALGLASQVRTVEVDIDAGWPDLGTLDLTWASMSLHHFADPPAVLRDVLAATRVGGIIAVAEFAEPLRFLPADLGIGRPDFESRVLDVIGRSHAAEMPTLGSVWAPRMSDAGWSVIAEHDLAIDLNPPTHPDAGRYAHTWFARLAEGRADGLDADDKATLTALLDKNGPHAVTKRTDLHIRGIRTITIARRD